MSPFRPSRRWNPSDDETALRAVEFSYYSDSDEVSPNRLQSVQAQGLTTSFGYDEDGNLVSETTEHQQTTYLHDEFGRLAATMVFSTGEEPQLQMVQMNVYFDAYHEMRTAVWDSLSADEDKELPRLTVYHYDEIGQLIVSLR